MPTLIPNGVDVRPFEQVTATAVAAARDRYQLPQKFILAVGAHRPHKNHEVLVQAIAAVPGDVGLVIVGNPDHSFRNPLPGLIAGLGLESRVQLVPDVADEWLPAVYRAASVFAFPSLAEGYGLPVLEAMAAGVPVVTSDIRVMAEVAGSAALMVPPRDVAGWASAITAALDLERAADRPVRTYSGGMRRRLDLAASLLGQPSVLFLEEPTTGLDPQSRLTLWDIIGELVSAGTTLLLTTQYLDEADRLADRICVIDGGRVAAEGSPAELKTRVGASYLRLTIPATASLDRAAEVVSGYAAGPVRRLTGHRGLDIPVIPRPGLVTEIVRALDAAGINVDDIAVRHPSLDDVFASLTGPVAA